MAVAAGMAAPAQAQVAASVGVESDYRFRGRTLSAGRPTASVQLSYDHPSGVYLTAAGIGVASRDGPDLLGYQLNAGYARRVSTDISVEAGVIRSEYGSRYSTGRSAHYTEVYAGLSRRNVTARVYYSPDYFYKNYRSLYGELEIAHELSPKWIITGHFGALTYLDLPKYFYGSGKTQHDWRVGASRQLGRFEVHAALSGGGPDRQYYDYGRHNLTAFTVGASVSF